MQIKNIRTKLTGDKISLLADCKIRPIGHDTVYFAFDKKYQDFLYEDASPFAATLLVPSMFLGQDIIIEGSISEKLYDGMQKIIKTFVGWNIGMKSINIKVDRMTKDDIKAKNVATFFSGGVDSFYTYLKHKSDTEDKISHFVLIKGTDIDLSSEALWEKTLDNIRSIASAENIELIEVESNIQALLEAILTPNYTHGGSLAAVGLCLRRGLKKIYIPSSFNCTVPVIPWGTHIELDNNWSSENLVFEHDGSESNRVQKVERQVAKSSLAMKYLRVCYMNIKGTYNCGKCDKCIRTMINLRVADKLKDAETFPRELDNAFVTEVVKNSGYDAPLHQENLLALKEKGLDQELQIAIEEGLKNVVFNNRSLGEKLFKKILYLDHMYFRGWLFHIWLKYIRDKIKK